MSPADDPRDVVLQAENAIGASVFTPGTLSTTEATTEAAAEAAAAAVTAAVAAARDGRRAAAVLRPSDVWGALAAIRAAAVARAPIVVHVVGGAEPGPGRDEIAAALDMGAGLLVTWSAQDSVDLALAARRAAEDAETPFVIVTDGGGPVMALPGSGLVDRFLGAPALKQRAAAPSAEGKRAERSFAGRVPFALAAALRELGELTGRPLAPVERYEVTDAEELLVASGQAFVAARAVAEAQRRAGRRVGAVGVRALRPFFAGEVVKAASRARGVAVLEPFDVALAPAGPLAQSLKAAFADALTWAPGFPGVGRIPLIVSAGFATIDGGVGEREVAGALAELGNGDRARRILVFGSDG